MSAQFQERPILEAPSAASPSHWGRFLATAAQRHHGTHPADDMMQRRNPQQPTLTLLVVVQCSQKLVCCHVTHFSNQTQQSEEGS